MKNRTEEPPTITEMKALNEGRFIPQSTSVIDNNIIKIGVFKNGKVGVLKNNEVLIVTKEYQKAIDIYNTMVKFIK